MGIKMLIERLNQYSQSLIAYKLGADFADTCMDAAAVLSTLQAENEKLRKELEWKDMVIELAQRKEREAKGELERVNLVRCKDCKMSRPGGLGYVWCGLTAMPPDGFCSNGQQKED